MNDPEIQDIKDGCLVFDIETSASWSDGKPININTNFDDYVERAKVKWIGMYSYKYDKYISDEVYGNEEKIKAFIEEHDTLVGFNNDEFDAPVMFNNDLMPDKRFKSVDCMTVLGDTTFYKKDGASFKNRGGLMGYKFPNNKLRTMAEVMGLETQKGDIDYMIFFQDEWTDEERAEIIKYLDGDVKATKQMFDKLWDFWMPFTEFISDDNIKNLSWIRSSIASLTYKAACKTLDVEETYGEHVEGAEKEKMGGRVIEPKYEEARKVWYVDFTSLYPHIYAMFNLFSEVDPLDMDWRTPNIWHGNDVFEVRGYYDISEQHILSKDVADKLKLRRDIKKEMKVTGIYNPTEYAIKIFLNSLYGAQRSPIFEQIHTPNGGWDCCWLGQQIQILTENMMSQFGFETIAGDTDSIFVMATGDTPNTEEHIRECLKTVVQKIKDNVPFPAETYNIDIEHYLEYVMWPFAEQPIQDLNGNNLKNEKGRLIKEYKGKKKNYLYLYKQGDELKLNIMGMPIIKDNATALGKALLEDVLKPKILAEGHAKFDKTWMNEQVQEYLKKPEALDLLSVQYKVKPVTAYKNPSQIQAQISAGYFDGGDGVIRLIKNKVIGKAGKTAKYCIVDEAIEHCLEMKDIDLTKVTNELEPFIK